jgi:hypothetical protein
VHVARMEAKICAFEVLVRKPEGKSPLGRPRRILDNIKMECVECESGPVSLTGCSE